MDTVMSIIGRLIGFTLFLLLVALPIYRKISKIVKLLESINEKLGKTKDQNDLNIEAKEKR